LHPILIIIVATIIAIAYSFVIAIIVITKHSITIILAFMVVAKALSAVIEVN